jgi:myo-inositol-1-phosphate synthase
MSGRVRVAVIGVGNCASSLVQGVEYYRNADPAAFVPGLMHVDLGGYHVSDVEFSAAFDIDATKVGRPLHEAIWAGQNNTVKFADVPASDVVVQRGMTHDGLGKYLSEVITKAPGSTADIAGILRDTGTDVVVNYLPVGSETATKWYTEQILSAGCAMVNCMPVFIAREQYWRTRFEQRGVPIIGDDIKSQVGATIIHVPWLHDRKWAYIRLEGRSFGDVPLNVELKLEVHDSPNSAGIVIDAVRCCKLALDRGVAGALEGPSSYLMKSPPHQVSDNVARQQTEDFILGDLSAPSAPAAPSLQRPAPASTTSNGRQVDERCAR